MAATHRRRAGWAGAARAAGSLILGAPASPGAAQTPPAEPPHGQLLQAPDGGLYLLVAGQAHPITPAPLTAEAYEALAAAGPGEALPDGAFWLMPAAAPPVLAPVAPPTPPGPARAATARPAGVSYAATATAQAGTSARGSQRAVATAARAGAAAQSSQSSAGASGFFATQTAVAPRGAQVTPAASSATRPPNGWPAGQS